MAHNIRCNIKKLKMPMELKCPYCKCAFTDPTTLQRHRMGSHKMDPKSSKHIGTACNR